MGSLEIPKAHKPWIETPLIESNALSKAAGCRIFLKLENLQPSGSFKSRGVGNLVYWYHKHHDHHKTLHFYASSGGNAGLACVTAARALGHPATVVVPTTTKPLMISKIKAAGATEVIQVGASWREADTHLCEEILAPLKDSPDVEGVYIPPFDDPRIWHGCSYMVDELAHQIPDGPPDAVVCSVGGGGLLNGIAEGFDRFGWKNTTILAMETAGADSLAKSVQQGGLVTLPRITSQATSLGCTRVCDKTFEVAQRPNVKSVVLSDGEAAMGVWRLADDQRLLVELACGVCAAVCYDGRLKKHLPSLREDSRVVIVVCGGNVVTLDMINEYRQTYKQYAGTGDLDTLPLHSIPL